MHLIIIKKIPNKKEKKKIKIVGFLGYQIINQYSSSHWKTEGYALALLVSAVGDVLNKVQVFWWRGLL